MANALSKNELVLFDEVLEAFDANNITAEKVGKFDFPATEGERSNLTIWRPIPYVSVTTSGIDVSSDYADLTQLSVPTTVDQIKNVPWVLNSQELNDPSQREAKAKSAGQALSAAVDKGVANVAGLTGTLVVPISGAMSGYADVAEAEALMLEQEIADDLDKCMILNARDYSLMAADLAGRNNMTGKPGTAYERSMIGDVAGFDTRRASFLPRIAAAAGGVTTVDGDQDYTPLATSTNAINGGESNVDNRTMILTVDNSVGVAVGDAFTIADVYAVSHIKKENTNQLKTFRVISIPAGGVTLEISPPIIPADGTAQSQAEYANVNTEAKDTAALTWLNANAAQSNVFFAKDSIQIGRATLAVPEMDMAGVNVTRARTDSGIEIIFAKQGQIDDLTAKYRLTINYGVDNLQPEMNGIVLGGQ